MASDSHHDSDAHESSAASCCMFCLLVSYASATSACLPLATEILRSIYAKSTIRCHEQVTNARFCCSFALLASVSCPVLLKAMARFRKFLPDFEAGYSRGKKFLMVYTYQPTEPLNHVQQLSSQREGVFFKLASDQAIFRCIIHLRPS